jgi:hypothetical protein
MIERRELLSVMGLAVAGGANAQTSPPSSEALAIESGQLREIGRVSDRQQSYNVEMLEVTGGRFWRPYGPELERALREPAPQGGGGSSDTPSGMNPALYEYRPPIDLSQPRLRTLAKALGPSYVRVSGTWANTTYLPAMGEATPSAPPQGYGSVLTHDQWRGVIEFARAVDAEIVTSFATGMGTRDAQGVWTTDQAQRFVDVTRQLGGRIAAAEWMNEPSFAAMGGAPKGYDAAAYGRDYKIFHDWARRAVPEMRLLGPGSVGETTGDWKIMYGDVPVIHTEDMLKAMHPAGVDAFSYHHYGATSRRCEAMGRQAQTTPEEALSEQWLRRTDETLAFYKALRDRYQPGKPLWLTETADAACGGNPLANTFRDTFRYVDQLGRLARHGVEVVMHNTLVASDYGLLDDKDLSPKPSYWAALLWQRLMGTTVLDSGVPIAEGRHVYAHELRGQQGGAAMVAINNSRDRTTRLRLPGRVERYTLSAPSLDAKEVLLNGRPLALGAGNAIPEISPATVDGGNVALEPATITFLALPGARR